MKGDMLQGGAKCGKDVVKGQNVEKMSSKEGSCEEHTAVAGLSDTDGEG